MPVSSTGMTPFGYFRLVSVGRLYPAEAYVRLRGEQRKAMADQLSAVSKLRLRDRAGGLSPQDMAAVERVICLQLGL